MEHAATLQDHGFVVLPGTLQPDRVERLGSDFRLASRPGRSGIGVRRGRISAVFMGRRGTVTRRDRSDAPRRSPGCVPTTE
jgi:hypothetical protein